VSDPLARQCREFAGRISDLLNNTVANGVRLSAVVRRNEGWIARGISGQRLLSELIPLTIDGRAPSCFINVVHRLRMDDEQQWAANVSTTFGVYARPGIEPWFRYEYERDKDGYPESHFHIDADPRTPFPFGVRDLAHQHFPVGGRRFRVSLEDVIEHLVAEGYARARAGWEAVVQEHRQEWLDRQLRAAVRRFPDLAADQLLHLGYGISVPGD